MKLLLSVAALALMAMAADTPKLDDKLAKEIAIAQRDFLIADRDMTAVGERYKKAKDELEKVQAKATTACGPAEFNQMTMECVAKPATQTAATPTPANTTAAKPPAK